MIHSSKRDGSGQATAPSRWSTCLRAATLLAQGAGRLIRSSSDSGVVAVRQATCDRGLRPGPAGFSTPDAMGNRSADRHQIP